MSTIAVNEDVAKKIINSYNLEAKDDIYDVCYKKWFRKLVPMLPLTNKKNFFLKEKKILSSWQEADKEGALPEYFAGKDELLLCAGLIENKYDVRYAGDYFAYIKERYRGPVLVDAYRRFARIQYKFGFEAALEVCLELLHAIEDKENYEFLIYDTIDLCMVFACETLRLRYTLVFNPETVDYMLPPELGIKMITVKEAEEKKHGCVLFVPNPQFKMWDKYKFKMGVVIANVDRMGIEQMQVYSRNVVVLPSDRITVFDLDVMRMEQCHDMFKTRVQPCLNCKQLFSTDANDGVKILNLCVNCRLSKYKKKRRYGNFDFTDQQHRARIKDDYREGKSFLVTSGYNWIHRRDGHFFFRVVDEFFYIIGSGFRKLFKIYAEDYWDGISLFYLRTIDVDGVVISIYRERDKMSISEMSDVIKRRIRDNKSEIIER